MTDRVNEHADFLEFAMVDFENRPPETESMGTLIAHNRMQPTQTELGQAVAIAVPSQRRRADALRQGYALDIGRLHQHR
jgi:hypothetical protein